MAENRLRNYGAFARFWTASTVSDFGTYITTLALQVLVVVTLHGSATEVGLINAGRWLPYMLLGLVVGALVDRYRRRPILVTTDIGRGVLLGLIPLLWAMGLISVPLLVAFMVAFGTLSLVNDAAYQSFLPRLVPATLLTPANARLQQSAAVAQTSGPVAAAALVTALGAPIAILADALSYLLSGLVLATVRAHEPRIQRERTSRRSLRTEIGEGLNWVYRHPMLAPMALSGHAWFLSSGVVGTVFAPYALRTLHLGALGLGVVLAAAGVGGLVGTLASSRAGRVFGVGPTIVVAHALMPLAVALMALAPSSAGPAGQWVGWVMVGAGQFVLGLTLGLESPIGMGYRQSVTPDRLQGRTNGTMRSINRAMVVIGAPLGGVIGDTIGYRPALWVGAAGILAVAVGLGISRFRHASYADGPPDLPRSQT